MKKMPGLAHFKKNIKYASKAFVTQAPRRRSSESKATVCCLVSCTESSLLTP